MEILKEVLPLILYGLGSILLIVLIILGVKLIKTMNKIEEIVDDINVKVSKLDGFFNIIDYTTDKLVSISDSVVDGVSSLINRVFKRKKRKESEEDYE